ncbi:MAG TPA: hypothetical protein VM657_04475 [Sphingomonas sp.]|nr:hypothetical protein [Sphingomonas sp.]
MSRFVGHFEIIPRARRAREAIRAIRRRSKLFKKAIADGDARTIETVSSRAWDDLTKLFETLRNERDHGYLDDVELSCAVGLLIEPATQQEQALIAAKSKIDRSHANCGPLNLREALNKLGHYNGDLSTYRVDGRGAHYLVLGGRRGNRYWVAEILVSRLCKGAASAAKAIRQFPRT